MPFVALQVAVAIRHARQDPRVAEVLQVEDVFVRHPGRVEHVEERDEIPVGVGAAVPRVLGPLAEVLAEDPQDLSVIEVGQRLGDVATVAAADMTPLVAGSIGETIGGLAEREGEAEVRGHGWILREEGRGPAVRPEPGSGRKTVPVFPHGPDSWIVAGMRHVPRLLTCAALLFGAFGCAVESAPGTPRPARLVALGAPAGDVSLRGLSVVSSDLFWASGQDGTVLRGTEGGRRIDVFHVAEADGADLRSIHGFDADEAVAATAGTPARILRTQDGGDSWQVVHAVEDPKAFFDSIAFGPDGIGYVFGDPLGDGAHFVLRSPDRGRTWERVRGTPPALPGEAGFAASNSCIAVTGSAIHIGTGGAAARVLRGPSAWTAAETPLLSGASSQGVFAVAFVDAQHGVVVGGDYVDHGRRDGTAAWTADGGRTFTPARVPPGGFRSDAAFAPGFGPWTVFAVGSHGADRSDDGGQTWRPLPEGARAAHHAIGFAADAPIGFAVGSSGRIARIEASDRED
ncbi:MAG: hypothetical protein RL562_1656 [Planctomycetota bacterium]